jgi:hypothetical protein
MATLLDILQSVIIGGMIFLMILSFKFRMRVVTEDVVGYNLTQYDILQTSHTLENDFYKIGYNTSTTKKEKVILAENQRLKFLSDIDNDGDIDSVLYSMSDSLALSGTQNPSDKYLYRKVNNENQLFIGKVTDFRISYFDSLGNSLSTAALTDSTGRKKILEVGFYLKVEAATKFEYENVKNYTSALLNKKIRIKNS